MKTSLYLFIALLLLCGGCEKALPGFAEEWHGVQFILDGEYNATLNDRVKMRHSRRIRFGCEFVLKGHCLKEQVICVLNNFKKSVGITNMMNWDT